MLPSFIWDAVVFAAGAFHYLLFSGGILGIGRLQSKQRDLQRELSNFKYQLQDLDDQVQDLEDSYRGSSTG